MGFIISHKDLKTGMPFYKVLALLSAFALIRYALAGERINLELDAVMIRVFQKVKRSND